MSTEQDPARETTSDPPDRPSGRRTRAADAALPATSSKTRLPSRPATLDPKDLGFEPQPAVRWFQPLELVRAGVKALLADLFGAYADRRELQAALHPLASLQALDYSNRREIGLDYVADLGDGFDATYAVAHLLAQKKLAVVGAPALDRGEIVILGGDQVYPTATRADYQNRSVGPFRAALPWSTDESRAPHLYAIPGNHDWYDGLTAFLRQFTQERWVGGWKTRQRRSYFALRLPQRYWLWGIDIQLRADIDEAQLEYFRRQTAEFEPGDRVILCTSEPSWVKDVDEPKAAGFKNLLYLMRLVEPHAKVVLVLTGDSHHYARYTEAAHAPSADLPPRERLFITAGGGGAFLHGTHTLPSSLRLEGLDAQSEPLVLKLGATYPSFADSEAQVRGLLAFPVRHWGFAMLWAALWSLLGLVLLSDRPVAATPFDPRASEFGALRAWPIADWNFWTWSPVILGPLIAWFAARALFRSRLEHAQGSLRRLPVDVLPWISAVAGLTSFAASGDSSPLSTFVKVVARSPASLLLLLLAVVGSAVYVSHRNGLVRAGIGLCHAALHVLVWLEICALLVSATKKLIPPDVALGDPSGALLSIGWLAGSSLAAGLASAMIFGLFLWFAGRYLPGQLNDVFSAIGCPDFKNFLRLRIAEDGSLTVWPIGVRRVPRRWVANPNDVVDAPHVLPAGGQSLEPALIEAPWTLSPRELGQRWSAMAPLKSSE